MVQVRGGAEFKTAGILTYFEDFKRGTNKEIELKDFFEITSNQLFDYNGEPDMGIATRITKIFKADIHGVMDQIEDQGLMLKQHLRDMEEALIQKKAQLKQRCFAKDQARQDSHVPTF